MFFLVLYTKYLLQTGMQRLYYNVIIHDKNRLNFVYVIKTENDKHKQLNTTKQNLTVNKICNIIFLNKTK